MTDRELIEKKLAFIETCTRELRELARPDLIAQDVRLSAEQAATMHRIAGFRNVVVHGYQRVDLRILRDIVEHRLGDLIDFVAAIRGRME